MTSRLLIFQIAFWGAVSVGRAGENSKLPPYSWPSYPKYNLNLEHKPLKGWNIETLYKGKGRIFLRESGRVGLSKGMRSKDNSTFKGKDENVYLLHFDYFDYRKNGGPLIKELEFTPNRPVFLGWDYHDFSTRFRRWTGERGLSRKYVIPTEFSGNDAVPLDVPSFCVDPRCPGADWQRFLMPVVTAEGEGDYMVINGFDRAGMTVGFIQLAAHTPDDMIPLMRHLISCKELQSDSYANPMRWFPELGLTHDGKLGYRKDGRVVSLEECTKHRNSNEGFRSWAYFREDFVRFCNPSVKEVNRAELEFAARWLMWSMSPKMRYAQLEPSKNNVVRTLMSLQGAPPKTSGADAAIAAVILHWRNGKEYQKLVSGLLKQKSPVKTFLKESWWIKGSSSDRKLLKQRVAAVRKLNERDPSVLARLSSLKFDFRTGRLSE